MPEITSNSKLKRLYNEHKAILFVALVLIVLVSITWMLRPVIIDAFNNNPEIRHTYEYFKERSTHSYL